jgi:ATP-citrate lyase beta-subunit
MISPLGIPKFLFIIMHCKVRVSDEYKRQKIISDHFFLLTCPEIRQIIRMEVECMAQRAIREYDAKKMLERLWKAYFVDTLVFAGKAAQVTPHTDWDQLQAENPWLGREKLVVKPDQLIGKRGKHGLILLNTDFPAVKKWVQERMGKPVTIGPVTGLLDHFIIEPFLPQSKEYYLAIKSDREGDTIYFSPSGGVDIEENWEKVVSIQVPVATSVEDADVAGKLPAALSNQEKAFFTTFIKGIFKFYSDLHFAFLEFNPLAVTGNRVVPLDIKARLDDTASFEVGKKWGDISFPPPFGRAPSREELFIKELDEGTGASLKLTILNPKGRIWTLNAGGGASVVYTDTIVDLGFAKDLANYGEYSGNPSTEFTYKYARTILDLFTREKDPEGKPKILIIGGGIANFTDVAQTLAGIIQALTEYKDQLKAVNARIYLRRGGPNWQEGLRKVKELGKTLGVPIEVHGPEMHMTRIVSIALQGRQA